MKTEYFMVLGAIAFFPLLLSVLLRLGIFRRSRALLMSMACVCAIYWTWDVAATGRGHWAFAPAYVMGIRLLGMPVEEWLFFVVIAFVSIFTYEAVRQLQERSGKG